jgi:hypothetical protein
MDRRLLAVALSVACVFAVDSIAAGCSGSSEANLGDGPGGADAAVAGDSSSGSGGSLAGSGGQGASGFGGAATAGFGGYAGTGEASAGSGGVGGASGTGGEAGAGVGGDLEGGVAGAAGQPDASGQDASDGASGCSNPITDPKSFRLTELTSNQLPVSVQGWSQAACQGAYNYVCPSGYDRTDCQNDAIGTHDGCASCLMALVTCQCH